MLADTMFTEDVQWGLLFAGSAFFGLAMLVCLWTVMNLGRRKSKIQEGYNYDEIRHAKLRRASRSFRSGERLILFLATWNRQRKKERKKTDPNDSLKPSRMEMVDQALGLVYPDQPWKAEEFVALRQFESLGIGFIVGLVFWNLADPLTGLVVGLVFAWTYYELQIQSIMEEGRKMRETIGRRLPFVMDLMALTIGAGASFPESIETAARENEKHPIGPVLMDVLGHLSRGRTIQQSMNDMADRVNEETVSELVFSINKADELGTPIAQTLAELADQMRLKRQQWGEKVAGEAQVKILFPGVLIMIACIIAILSPILMTALGEVF